MNERVLPYAALMLFGIGWGQAFRLARLQSVGGICLLA